MSRRKLADSNTVAKEVAESNKVMAQALGGVVSGVLGMAVPVR